VPGILPTASPDPGSTGPASVTPTPALPAGQVRVPNVVGLSEDEAIAAANAAQLNWTLVWRTDPDSPVGVYAQDLDAGTIVPAGTDFNFYSNRH
ncbi:MAG: PASTA domain-containing protein, partial [Chloroflexota bacterium]|nr:PASTA domain-containing protein [Chloroflexota bacterium]